MRTKAQIVQELLDEKKIATEDAVVLLMGNEKEYVYIHPTYPAAPIFPAFPASPYKVTCNSIN